jgi:hypothetical protein
MLLNKCEYGTSSVNWLMSMLERVNIEKKLYHIPLSNGLVLDYVKEVKLFVKKDIKDIDGIILDCTGEAPETARFTELIEILIAAGYSKNQILCIDSSIKFCPEFNNIIAPNWIASCHHFSNMQSFSPIQARDTLFLVLARLPKSHRVNLVVKFLEQGLDKFSTISCGSGVEHAHDKRVFDNIVPENFRNRFPMLIDNTIVDRHTGSQSVDDQFKRCLINVVIESCFENEHYGAKGPVGTHSWNRLFYTEKTDKCFYMGQLPIFLAKQGYVKILKDVYCFDMFDDIIDHSYDGIVDPMARIDAVANECVRLSKLGLENLINYPGLENRFKYNKEQAMIVKNRLLADSELLFNNWIKGL